MKRQLFGTLMVSAYSISTAMGTAPPATMSTGHWCHYPVESTAKEARVLARATLAINEIEPNDATGIAQAIPLGDGVGLDRDLDVAGDLSTNADVDFFQFTLAKGDMLGVAVLAGGAPDSEVAITDLDGDAFIVNDDHRGIATIYPPDSPFPGGVDSADSALTWIAPAGGDYLIRVTSWNASSSGSYQLQIRSRRPALELEHIPATQTIFVDFDGATINAARIFGFGRTSAVLSPLSTFLPRWDLAPEEEDDLIDAILQAITENMDDLRIPSLHGDRDSDGIDGHMDVEILNSRDHADPIGMPRVSRLIIGGTFLELGVFTIGVAQYIDPGNFGQDDTAVVLLDLLSAPSPEFLSINSIPIDASIRKVDAVGLIVGNIASHEVGHLLGNWHTENGNAVRSLMDAGGSLVNISGVGGDGILGTADDEDVDFITDDYESGERVAVGQEPTGFRTAISLATGAVPCVSDASCADGNLCNGIEICVDGSCEPGIPIDCDDADECTVDDCEPDVGCINAPVDCSTAFATHPVTDGSLGLDDLSGRTPYAVIDADRDTSTLSCCCVSDPLTPCCGNDVCDGQENCKNCPDECATGTSECGDGICAGPAGAENCVTCPEDCRCAGGDCGNGCCGDEICAEHGENANNCPVDCDPDFLVPLAGSCCGDGVCEGSEDASNCDIDCQACSVDADCDDGNACTDAVCIGGRCQMTNNSVACDDGLFCNGPDTCDGGKCAIHPGDPCVGGPECADTCDEDADTCNLPTGTPCTSDGNVCTDNMCDGGACVAVNNTDACDDGMFCTGADRCQDGECVGAGSPCQPEQFCHEPTQTCPPAADNLVLAVAPESEVVAPGDVITVTLDAVHLSEAINGVQVLIGYDASLMTLVDIVPVDLSLPDPLNGWTEIAELDVGGDVIWAAIINGGDISADQTVATLSFTAVDLGIAQVTFRADEPPVRNKITRSGNGTWIAPNLVDSSTIIITCDDGLFCNGTESFVGGACQPGAEACPESHCDENTDRCLDCLVDAECDDTDPCTADTCDADSGQCINEPILPCCGDGNCTSGEHACACPDDCGPPPESELDCDNGFDDDCDGPVDCDDPDCDGDGACPTDPICGNGVCEGNGEDCFTCGDDCRCTGASCSHSCCGDGVCAGENITNCPVDCGGIGFSSYDDRLRPGDGSSSSGRNQVFEKRSQRQ